MEKHAPSTIIFKQAIYGFENIKEYTLSNASQSKDNPFCLLKAVDGSVCFILLDPKIIDESYAPIVDEQTLQLLKVENSKDLRSYCIVVIPNDVKQMTINLRSPIIVSIDNGNAIQIILEDERYSIRHRIFDC